MHKLQHIEGKMTFDDGSEVDFIISGDYSWSQWGQSSSKLIELGGSVILEQIDNTLTDWNMFTTMYDEDNEEG